MQALFAVGGMFTVSKWGKCRISMGEGSVCKRERQRLPAGYKAVYHS